MGNLRKLTSLKLKQNPSLPCDLSFRSFTHYGNPKKAEVGSNFRPMDFGTMEECANNTFGSFQLSQYTVERNADIYGHSGNPEKAEVGSNSKPMEFVGGIMEESGNNAFGGSQHTVEQNTVESVSASAGSLPDKGGKASRYGAEATAENVGREARKSGVKSVVAF